MVPELPRAGARRSADARVEEAAGLAEAIGIRVVGSRSFRVRSVRPATLLGKGQVEEFDRWLAEQAAPAQPPAEPLAVRGQSLFLADGCGACHTIRGTPAAGLIGPDLTHVGSRLGLAAATLPNGPDDFRRWVAHTTDVKPGVLMPPFHMLPPDELEALAAYLKGLR